MKKLEKSTDTFSRPSKLSNWMKQAEVVSERSHDAETKVGAILINNESGAVIAQGYNGFVRGANDLTLPRKRPEKYPYMVHAEQNLMANCARHGISMENTTLVITLSPCTVCMRLMWQAGITRVVCRDLYRDVSKILKMKDIHIDISKTKEGLYVLEYSVKAGKNSFYRSKPVQKILRLLGISPADKIRKEIEALDSADSCEQHSTDLSKRG